MSASKDNKKTEITEAAIVAEIKKEYHEPLYQAPPSNLAAADFRRNVYRFAPKAGTPFKELLKPEYWVHVAETFKRGDIIEIFPEDGEYFAELVVMNSSRLWASTIKKSFTEINGVAKKAPDDNEFKVEWKGNHSKYTILRTSDKTVLKDGIADKKEAEEWIANHIKELAI